MTTSSTGRGDMRKLGEVITEVCTIEGIDPDLKKFLEGVRDDHLPYCPPESERIWWMQTQQAIANKLPPDPTKLVDWQKKFLKIWTGKDF